jgi:hypothetical protein
MRRSDTAKIGIALILLVSSGQSMAQDRDVKVRGRVVDRDGKPAAGATVARNWAVSEDDGKQEGPWRSESPARSTATWPSE